MYKLVIFRPLSLPQIAALYMNIDVILSCMYSKAYIIHILHLQLAFCARPFLALSDVLLDDNRDSAGENISTATTSVLP